MSKESARSESAPETGGGIGMFLENQAVHIGDLCQVFTSTKVY